MHAVLLRISILAAVVGSSCSVVATHSDAPRPRVRGPLPTRVQHPIRLTTLALQPRRATVQPRGSFALRAMSDYSSMFENGGIPPERVLLDGELWRNSLSLTYGVAPRTDLEVEIATLYATSGFLDRFVESWHDLFGLPQGGRESRPRFGYDMRVSTGGDELYQLDGNELGVGDVPVVLTHQLVEETASAPAIALRVGVELPLGSERGGFGNGALDWGAGVLAEKSWGRWTATGALDFVDARRASSFVGSGVDLYDGVDVRGGVEYRWNDHLSLLTGLSIDPPLTRDLHLKEIDREVVTLDVGAAFDVGERSMVLVGFQEDLIAKSGPDFGAFIAWTYSF